MENVPVYLIKSCSIVHSNVNSVAFNKQQLNSIMAKHSVNNVSFKILTIPNNPKLKNVKIEYFSERGKHKFMLNNNDENILTFSKFFTMFYI